MFTIELTPADEFVIMCSDGVWDVFSDEKACQIVAKALKETDNACDQAVGAAHGSGTPCLCVALTTLTLDHPRACACARVCVCVLQAKALCMAAYQAESEDNICAAVRPQMPFAQGTGSALPGVRARAKIALPPPSYFR